MTNPKSRIFAAVAGALSLGAAVAWAETPTQDQKIRDLEAKVAALEARQTANSKEMAATLDAVLRDSERRSQLLATSGDMGAGYDNGFYIRAGDAWVFRPGAQFQFRYIANSRDDVDGDDSEVEDGFEVRRMKFELGGIAITKDLEYFFQFAAENGTGDIQLEDAWAKYMFADDWGTRVGQFKDPVHHEELVSSKRQLAVDRSLVNELLGGGFLDRTQGVSLIYGGYNKNNPIAAEVVFHDGFNTDNTNFVSADWGVAARVEFLAMGDWKSYRDFSAMGNKEDLLVIGAGGDWTQTGDGDVMTGTIDAQFETAGGLSIYGAGLVRFIEEEAFPVPVGDDATDWGVLVQVGYMLNPAWEIFGRFDHTVFDFDQVVGEDSFSELTVGVNYFLGTNGAAGHRAKITVDLTYLPDGSPRAVDDIGILNENVGEDEWVLRAQFQLLI